MIRLVALILALFPLSLRAEVLPVLHDVVGVAADDVLNLRAGPGTSFPIVGSLAPDARGVEVVAVTGGWAVVNMPESTGYAALRYLKPQPGPDWTALEGDLQCLGTEPFWNLSITPGTGTAQFSTPEAPTPEVLTIGTRWPGGAQSTPALALDGGFLALRGQACSDGMSDRRYGIAADLYLTRDGAAHLSGCCTLTLP